MTPSNRLQRTALRAAADAERWANVFQHPGRVLPANPLRIRRRVKVQAAATRYDPSYGEYFKTRQDYYRCQDAERAGVGMGCVRTNLNSRVDLQSALEMLERSPVKTARSVLSQVAGR